jgi:L,D-peptidoglycan transpeptidase YkuD (ErfK/YbiS/YcfS/YnhG family)
MDKQILRIICSPSSSHAQAVWNGHTWPAFIGKNGPIAANLKIENDGYTPLGEYMFLQGFYRADRNPCPGPTQPVFPWRASVPGDGYCDDATDPLYNQLVALGHPCAEGLYRDSSRHDTSIYFGYNMMPIIPGKGSCLFLHGIEKEFTAGCVALATQHIRIFGEEVTYGSTISIELKA